MNENSIERVTGYRVGQQIFTTVKEAQIEAIRSMLDALDDGVAHTNANAAAEIIVNQADQMIAILSEKPELKVRKRRSDFGAKHSKKNSSPAQRNTTPVPQA